MPKNDDDEDDEANDGCQPHRIQLFGHCVFLLHVFCICICVGPPVSPLSPFMCLSRCLPVGQAGGGLELFGAYAGV